MLGYSTYFISGALAYLDGLPLLLLYRRERTSTPGGSATLDVLEEHEQRTNGNSCNTLQFKYSNGQVLTGGNHLQEQRATRGALIGLYLLSPMVIHYSRGRIEIRRPSFGLVLAG